jgi:hypothetical protein
MTEDKSTPDTDRVEQILAEAKKLAVEYYRLTGKLLGVTGEVAEYVASKTMHLQLAPPRTPGYDATRQTGDRIEHIQIKGRAFKPGKSQKLGKLKLASTCDIAMMVLLHVETVEATEIWEAPFSVVRTRLAVPGSKARARGVLSVVTSKTSEPLYSIPKNRRLHGAF